MFGSRTAVLRLSCALAASASALLWGSAAAAQQAQAAPAQTFDIDAYDVDGARLLDQATIEKAVYPFLGPNRTADDVEAARAALEKAYRARGYQSVVVEIPSQHISDRALKLHVVEQPVGRLRVVGSRYTELDKIKEHTPSLAEGKVPDLGEAQKELEAINRLPDRRVTPVVRPGAVPGTIDVDLKVKDTLPVHASVELNNDHARDTKPLRVSGTVRYSDLWQLGHTVSFTYLTAPERMSDAQVFAGSYLAPVWGTPWNVLVYGYNSNSDVATFGGATVLGKGYAIGVRGIYQLPSPANLAQSLNFGADFKHFDEDVILTSGDPTQTPIDYVPFVLSYSLQYAGQVSSANVTVSGTAGLRGLGSGAGDFDQKRFHGAANFVHLNLDADYTRSLGNDQSIFLRVSGQLANQPLVSSEQFSAGGLTSVRGYLQSEVVGDDGVLGQAELRFPSFAPVLKFVPGLDEWRFYVFADAAKLWVQDPLADQQDRFTLYSVGVGSRMQLLDHIKGDLVIGWPLRDGPVHDYAHPYAFFSVKSEF